MAYLLDTHTLIWAITDDPLLSTKAKLALINPSISCHFSTASLWEISIKHALRKLIVKDWALERVFEIIVETGFTELPLQNRHFLQLANLPFHHRDPFDRLLIAQALSENLTLVSCDEQLSKYGAAIMW